MQITEGLVQLWFGEIPILDLAHKFAAAFVFPDNTWRNWQAIAGIVSLEDETHMPFLADPQTNGGLLIAVADSHKNEFEQLWLEIYNGQKAKAIGRFTNETGIRVLG